MGFYMFVAMFIRSRILIFFFVLYLVGGFLLLGISCKWQG